MKIKFRNMATFVAITIRTGSLLRKPSGTHPMARFASAVRIRSMKPSERRNGRRFRCVDRRRGQCLSGLPLKPASTPPDARICHDIAATARRPRPLHADYGYHQVALCKDPFRDHRREGDAGSRIFSQEEFWRTFFAGEIISWKEVAGGADLPIAVVVPGQEHRCVYQLSAPGHEAPGNQGGFCH